jgi:xanthine/CO dehydrogenase XdhC/CoxF family maturation factor
MSELFDHIDKLKKTEPRVAVATLVNTRGTTPRKEGAKMVVGVRSRRDEESWLRRKLSQAFYRDALRVIGGSPLVESITHVGLACSPQLHFHDLR